MSGPAAATQASSSSSSTGKNGKEKQRQPQQPSAAAYHALIEAHMRGGHLEPALEAMAELQVVHGGKDPLAVSVYGGLRFCIEQLNDEAQVVQLFNAVTKRQVRSSRAQLWGGAVLSLLLFRGRHGCVCMPFSFVLP
jgi:hypothetical protein